MRIERKSAVRSACMKATTTRNTTRETTTTTTTTSSTSSLSSSSLVILTPEIKRISQKQEGNLSKSAQNKNLKLQIDQNLKVQREEEEAQTLGVEMESIVSDVNSNNGKDALPSLFGNHGVRQTDGSTTKDLEGLMAMNDNTLSQQIEFILQDTSMDEDNDDHNQQHTYTSIHYHSHNEHITAIEPKSDEHEDVAAVSSIKIENPPNTICASEYSSQQQQQQIEEDNTGTITTHQEHQLLNGRRIIIQSTAASAVAGIKQELLLKHVAAVGEELDDIDCAEGEELDDPELNDENLQDIEEEAQEAESEMEAVEEQLQHQLRQASQIKLEYRSDPPSTTPTEHIHFISATTPQLLLPSGTILSTTHPNAQVLPQLQRRPVYISNAVSSVAAGSCATIVRMPTNAVPRNGSSMAVLNVVSQNAAGIPISSSQLNLQHTTPSLGASVVVTSASSTTLRGANEILLPTVSTNVNSATAARALPLMITNTSIAHTNVIGNSAVIRSSAPITTTTTTLPTLKSTNAKIITTNNNNRTPKTPKKSAKKSVAAKSPVSTTSSNNNNSSNNLTTSNTISSSSNSSNNSNSTGIYQCSDCVERFDSKELFDIHRSGHVNNMKCAICNMVLKSLKNYEKHCLRCKPYECQICGRIVRFRPNFIKHMRVHTGQQSERHKYKCDVCHKEFMSFEYFKVHKKIHNENVNLTCEICGKVFSALASLRGHSKLHSGVKLHK